MSELCLCKAVISDHQPYGEVFLERADGRRERRLRDVAALRRPREMTLAGERHEIGQMTNQHDQRPERSFIYSSQDIGCNRGDP